jgi:hypothetical protein
MATYPVKAKKRALRKSGKDKVVVARAAGPFFSFRYSSTEVSLVDGKTRVRSRSARFEDGKLSSESFEGELDRGAYERMVSQAQRHFLGMLALFLPLRD